MLELVPFVGAEIVSGYGQRRIMGADGGAVNAINPGILYNIFETSGTCHSLMQFL